MSLINERGGVLKAIMAAMAVAIVIAALAWVVFYEEWELESSGNIVSAGDGLDQRPVAPAPGMGSDVLGRRHPSASTTTSY
mgnify:CR=1 FL=1